MQAPPAVFTVKVVGLTFVDGYPQNLLDLRNLHERRFVRVDEDQPMFAGFGDGEVEPIAAVLVRDPNNPHDSNAVEVHVPAIDQRVGFIPRDLAARVAAWLDAGRSIRCGISTVLVSPGHEDRPGVSLICERVDDDERSAA